MTLLHKPVERKVLRQAHNYLGKNLLIWFDFHSHKDSIVHKYKYKKAGEGEEEFPRRHQDQLVQRKLNQSDRSHKKIWFHSHRREHTKEKLKDICISQLVEVEVVLPVHHQLLL
jgi:hypothetical protein